MAKGSSRKRGSNTSDWDSASPSDDASSDRSAIPIRSSRSVRDYLPENYYRDVDDSRRWTPDPLGRAKTVTGNKPRIIVKRGPGGRPLRSAAKQGLFSGRAHTVVGQVTSRLGFSVPHDVLVCIRRAMRREVLFALKKRKAGAGAKRRRRNAWSDVDC